MAGEFKTRPIAKTFGDPSKVRDSQGTLSNVADAWMLDTSLGQFMQKGELMGFSNMFMPNQYDPAYNVFEDKRLDTANMPLQLLNELATSYNYEDALGTIAMWDENIARAERLDRADAGVTRFLTGFLDPINLIPVPMALGRGFVKGFTRTLAPNAAIISGAEMARTSLDPTDTPIQVAANIGFGTIMASTIGGLFGMVPKNARLLSKQVDTYAGIRETANQMGADAPGPTMREMALTPEKWEQVKHRFPEGTTREDILRGTGDDGLGSVIRFQSARVGDEGFGKQVYIRDKEGESGTYELIEITNGEHKIVTQGNKQQLVELADQLGTERVSNFASRHALDLGEIKMSDMHPEMPDPKVDPEGHAKYIEEQHKVDAPVDQDGVRLPGGNGFTNRHAFRDLMDSEIHHYEGEIKAADAEIARLEAEKEVLAKQARHRNQHSRPKNEVLGEVDAIEAQLIPMRAHRQKLGQTLDEVNERVQLAEESNNPADYMLQPTGIGLETLYGKSHMFPFFSLTETKLVKLAPDLAADWQRIAYRLAGSPGLMYRGGKRGVGVGTSAEMQAIGWWHNFRSAKESMDAEYAKLYGFGEQLGPTAQMMREITEPVSGDTAGMTFHEFRQKVGEALIHNGKVVDEGMDAATRKAIETSAAHWRGFFDKFKEEGARLGVFQTQETLARRITRLDSYIKDIEARAGSTKGGRLSARVDTTYRKQLDKLEIQKDQLETQLEAMKHLGDEGEWLSADYFYRLWTPETIKPNEAAFKEILRTHFKNDPYAWKQGKRVRLSTDPTDIEVRVNEAYDNIIRESDMDDALGMVDTEAGRKQIQARIDDLKAELDEMVDPSTLDAKTITRKIQLYEDLLKNPHQIANVLPAPLRSRALNIHNKEVIPYIETDIDVVAQRYLQKVAPIIEVTRNFGDRNLTDYRMSLDLALQERIAKARADGKTTLADELEKEHANLNEAVDNLRDMVLGTFGLSKNPAHWTGRATRLATAWMNLTSMGKVVFSALNDTGNYIGYMGFRRALGDGWRYTLARVNKDASEWNIGRQEAEWAGEAAQIWSASRAKAMTDIGGLTAIGKFEKGVQKHQDRFFILNLLTPWTDFMEGMTGTMAQSAIIRDALAIADGTISKSRMAEVAKLGMTPDLARNIAKVWRKLPEEQRMGRHLYLANSDKWAGLGASESTIRAFRAMLATEINNLVPAPKAADRPTFMHYNWGRVMFQYRGFSFAATTKIMMANLQRKDKRALNTVMSMIGISYIVDLMRQPDYISLDPGEQLLRAVERSAVGGIFMDMNQVIESASDNQIGIRPMFGMDSFDRDVATRVRFGEALGPSVNQWATFANAYLSDDAEVADKTRALRYIIPYNNLLYYSWLIDRMQRGATRALE